MFNRNTLFVIGAGASYEVSLPVGTALAQAISRRVKVRTEYGKVSDLNDEYLIRQLYRSFAQQRNELSAALKLMEDGVQLANSIDDFLHIHNSNAMLVQAGKAAIVRSIVEAEKGSDLYVDESNIYNTLQYSDKVLKSWFVKFTRVLGPGRSAEDCLTNVSFIVFNYDRCLEHFLSFAISHLYGIHRRDAAQIVTKANIIHPYGQVGSLREVPFGAEDDVNYDCVRLSANIKTYTEQIEEEDTIARIKRAVSDADCLVFLGFAYHKQNMDLLRAPRKSKRPQKQVYGTAYGMSDADTAFVATRLDDMFPQPRFIERKEPPGGATSVSAQVLNPVESIRIENKLTCSDLFDYYAKSIAG